MTASGQRVTFVASGRKPYSPGVKPFLGFSRAAQDTSVETQLIAWKCAPRVIEEASRKLRAGRLFVPRSEGEILKIVRDFNPDVLMSDDATDRLDLVSRIARKVRCRTAAYLHVFRAIRSLRPTRLDKKVSPWLRLKFHGSHAVPFYLAATRYRHQLRTTDCLVANSRYSEMLVNTLYGVRPHGVVYPPMDCDIFRTSSEAGVARNGYLVFVDGELNIDTAHYSHILCQLADSEHSLELVGSSHLTNHLIETIRNHKPRAIVRGHDDVPDSMLASLYRRVRASYLPQEWEAYGNVGPESLMSGTPVVLDRPEPWLEVTGPSPMIRIVRTPSQTSKLISSPFPDDPKEFQSLQDRIAAVSSLGSSFRYLMDLIEDAVGLGNADHLPPARGC